MNLNKETISVMVIKDHRIVSIGYEFRNKKLWGVRAVYTSHPEGDVAYLMEFSAEYLCQIRDKMDYTLSTTLNILREHGVIEEA